MRRGVWHCIKINITRAVGARECRLDTAKVFANLQTTKQKERDAW
jgi:hypothetical protein